MDAATGVGAAVASADSEFDAIYASYSRRVLGLCLHVVGDRADAEDAAQETFLAVLHGLPGFRGEARLSTWIYRIALRTAIRVRARRPRTSQLEVDPPGEHRDPAIERERSRHVHEALACLTAEHRAVLGLFSLDGLSHREIAETLGIPEGTVWSRLHLARKKLAAELERLGFQRA